MEIEPKVKNTIRIFILFFLASPKKSGGLSKLFNAFKSLILYFYLFLILKKTNSARQNGSAALSKPTAAALEWTHLQDTVISTLVAGMLPLMGSRSQTVAVASTFSITSPSMLAGDAVPTPRPASVPLNLHGQRRRGGAQRTGEQVLSRQTS